MDAARTQKIENRADGQTEAGGYTIQARTKTTPSRSKMQLTIQNQKLVPYQLNKVYIETQMPSLFLFHLIENKN
jgi:hypothetical protein